MSEKLTLREKLHIGEKRPDGEKPRMSKKLKKGIIAAACVVGVCGAVWGGLTIARNAQRGDVNVYAVNECAMTDYWGDTSNTSGMVTTDKLQKIYISQSQTVKKVWVKEGDNVKKGTVLVSYDSTLTQATVERAKIDYDRQTENLEVMKNELELLKKAKNKETLEAEYDKLEKELNKLIEDATKIPDDNTDVVDLKQIIITDDMKLGTGSGNDKDNAIYYYRTTDSDGSFALSQADLMHIFSSLGKTDGTLYLVFVTRAGNKLGGAVMGNEGYILTAVTEDVPSGGETGGGETGGGEARWRQPRPAAAPGRRHNGQKAGICDRQTVEQRLQRVHRRRAGLRRQEGRDREATAEDRPNSGAAGYLHDPAGSEQGHSGEGSGGKGAGGQPEGGEAEAGQEAGGAGRRQRVRGVRRHGEGRAGPGRGL